MDAAPDKCAIPEARYRVDTTCRSKADVRRHTLVDGTWLATGRGVPCLNNEKRKAEHSVSTMEKQIWVIREVKIKAKRSIRKRLSVLKRKNEN